MRKSVIATGLALAVTGISHAGTYNTELRASYSTGEIETPGADADVDQLGIGGEYYFNGVDDSKGPLAEAAFLDRASSVRANYIDGEFDGRFNDEDFDGFSLGGRLVDPASGWIFEVDYTEVEADDSGDVDTFDFSVGKYIAENTSLSFTYSTTDTDGGGDVDLYAVDIKHIASLAGGAYLSVTGNFGIGDADEADDPLVYGGSLTYYPTRNIGVGASLDFVDSDDTEDTTFGVFGSWFPSESLELRVSYDMSDDDETDEELDTFTIGAAFRF